MRISGLLHLWIIYLPSYAVLWITMIIVNNIRKKPIEDGSQYGKGDAWRHFLPLIVFLTACILTPIQMRTLPAGLIVTSIGLMIALAALISYSGITGLNTKGIYRFSRNPMYVGGALIMAGVIISGMTASLHGALLMLSALPWAIMTHLAVLREESFLEKKFGTAFARYRGHTPRYIGLPVFGRKRYLS